MRLESPPGRGGNVQVEIARRKGRYIFRAPLFAKMIICSQRGGTTVGTRAMQEVIEITVLIDQLLDSTTSTRLSPDGFDSKYVSITADTRK